MTGRAQKSCCAGLYELPLTRLLLGASFHPGGVELTEQLARSAALGPGERVLDLASGRGDTALHLARRYGADVLGLDYSHAQVLEASARARELGLARRARFQQGDAERLPFADDRFDVVFCECALCTFPDRGAALTEVRRVLKPGGVLALSDVVLEEPVPAELDTLLGQVLCISGALSSSGYLAALREGGFTHTRAQDASHSLRQLVDRIEERVGSLASQIDAAPLAGVPRALAAARAFVARGGVGYATFTAR